MASKASKIDETGAVSLYHSTTDNQHFLPTSLSAHPRVPGDGEQKGEIKFFTAPINVLHCTCRNLERE